MAHAPARWLVACLSCGLLSTAACGDSQRSQGATTTGDGGSDGGGGAATGGSGGSVDEMSCDSSPPLQPPIPDQLELQTEFGDPAVLEVRTSGIWAIWWYPQFDHAADAEWLFEQLDDVRCRSIRDLARQDPPNPAAGVYYNVYIHHGADDDFPTGWANGQGTDSFGQPFLTLPDGAHLDEGNVHHEGFHVFQYSSDSPGFAYSGDSQWYIESTAQWYGAWRRPDAVDAFIEAGAIDGNPHLTLWHSFSNEAPGDPTDWMFQVRQYAMHTYLFYLTEVAGIDRDLITSGFYGGVLESPQQFHFDGVGGDLLRDHFADWAAHNTADFDYLLPAQVERARDEVLAVGDPDNIHPYVAQYADVGTAGQWVTPPASQTPRSWAYNVVRVDNTEAVTYTFSLRGESTGSAGAAAHFEGRAVVIGDAAAAYTPFVMTDAVTGDVSVTVSANDAEVYFVVASVPANFSGNQTFSYEYSIERQ